MRCINVPQTRCAPSPPRGLLGKGAAFGSCRVGKIARAVPTRAVPANDFVHPTAGPKIFSCRPSLALDYDLRCVVRKCQPCSRRASSGHHLRRSEAWRPAAAACNRRPGRYGTPPAGHYDPDARSSL